MFGNLINNLNQNISAFERHVPFEEKDKEKRDAFLNGMKAVVEQIKESEEFIKDHLAAETFEDVVKYLAEELDYDFVSGVLKENIQGFEDVE